MKHQQRGFLRSLALQVINKVQASTQHLSLLLRSSTLSWMWLCVVTWFRVRSQVDIWKWQGLQVTRLQEQKLSVGAALCESRWHPVLGSHESHFYILPILLVGSPLVEHCPAEKDHSVTISSVNEYASPPSPNPCAASHQSFLLQLQVVGTCFF